jgi:Zn-dependent M32 family carboxypeptidase
MIYRLPFLFISKISFKNSFRYTKNIFSLMSSFENQNSATVINYRIVEKKLKEIETLNGIKQLLGWDEQVMLAKDSTNARMEQSACLAAIIYDKQNCLDLEKSLKLFSSCDLSIFSSFELANIRDAIRDYELASRVTKEMTVRGSELEGKGYHDWVSARTTNNYSSFINVLSEIIALKIEMAGKTHPNLSPYDGNIDLFERGMKVRIHFNHFYEFISLLNFFISRVTVWGISCQLQKLN